MEMPGRRSNYTLLSQYPEEQQAQLQQPSKFSVAGGSAGAAPVTFYESLSAEKNKGKTERGFDWDGDHRLQQGGGRIGSMFPSIGLQRQSSGSSFGESSLSGDYYNQPLSVVANDQEVFGQLQEDGFKVGGGESRLKVVEAGGSSSSKSWAQQTEESYQLQLALALRLSSEATCADDPNFLDPVPDESALRSSSSSAEAMSHRFWVNGCLSYFDKIPDGFYVIHGMDPYVWTVCSDLQETGRIPSIESLKGVDSCDGSSIEVILIDKRGDPGLRELQSRVQNLSCSCITKKEMVDQLARLVCHHMGGAASTGEDGFLSNWKDCSEVLKDCLGSVVFPLGSLSFGLCRHRALLFKVLADTIDLPCRVAKGCKYCRRDDASSCLVRFGPDREYLVDLIEKPGCLCEPDSLLNGPSSISISSPLRLPKFRTPETTENFRSLAKQYFLDCQSLNLVFDDSSADAAADKEDVTNPQFPRNTDTGNPLIPSNNNNEVFVSPLPQDAWLNTHELTQNLYNPPLNVGSSKPPIPLNRIHPNVLALPETKFTERGQLLASKSNELSLDVEDFEIPWSDLVLKERIGAGSFGIVHRADWHGSDVAVKILMEQDFHAERFKEFLREVAIMKRLRHPNVVLFMGAVTQPPNLSIVTEYLSRGSLYRLLHRPGPREMLDERRRLNMAYDVFTLD
ncbi:PREDICTED: serine/threonine-protein kinase CTR1 isoform X2 [Nelumbo nucifera]|uniref:non-specific serine/threonine protein kinase n=1 Tax=Nelumbo nucifera TaxID=4432 RepID=A0A1U7YWC7_NELNU|nr:PREDICTED: serine/threonine-protein kinase CTR1 isoform X2 [Nelumbo nucifera]